MIIKLLTEATLAEFVLEIARFRALVEIVVAHGIKRTVDSEAWWEDMQYLYEWACDCSAPEFADAPLSEVNDVRGMIQVFTEKILKRMAEWVSPRSRWIHFNKNKETGEDNPYEVLHVASVDGGWTGLYQARYGTLEYQAQDFVRSLEEFLGKVDRPEHNYIGPRFHKEQKSVRQPA